MAGCGCSDLDDDDVVQRTLKVEKEFEAELSHRPGGGCRCDGCLKGKARQKLKKKATFSRPLQKYGDIGTCDHIYMRDWFKSPGIGNKPDASVSESLEARTESGKEQ